MKRVSILAFGVLALAQVACGAGPQIQEVTLDAKDIAYGTNTIEVFAGRPVRLTLTDSGALDHDFAILEIPVVITDPGSAMPGHDMGDMNEAGMPQLHVAAVAGQSNAIEFTPSRPGAYEFFCSVAGHKTAGMVGQLIVKQP